MRHRRRFEAKGRRHHRQEEGYLWAVTLRTNTDFRVEIERIPGPASYPY